MKNQMKNIGRADMQFNRLWAIIIYLFLFTASTASAEVFQCAGCFPSATTGSIKITNVSNPASTIVIQDTILFYKSGSYGPDTKEVTLLCRQLLLSL